MRFQVFWNHWAQENLLNSKPQGGTFLEPWLVWDMAMELEEGLPACSPAGTRRGRSPWSPPGSTPSAQWTGAASVCSDWSGPKPSAMKRTPGNCLMDEEQLSCSRKQHCSRLPCTLSCRCSVPELHVPSLQGSNWTHCPTSRPATPNRAHFLNSG